MKTLCARIVNLRCLLVFACTGVFASSYAVNYLDSGWTTRVPVIFNTSSSGANVMGTVSSFPVVLKLSPSTFVFSQAATNGQDIRFTSATGTPLPLQIAYWNASEQLAEVWVLVDSVKGNNATQSIFMYFGKSGATSTSNGPGVFDTSKGYQAVWHLNESVNTTIADATINAFSGTPLGTTKPADTTGLMGKAKNFDGLTGFYNIPGTASSKLNFPEQGVYTLSTWAYPDNLSSEPSLIDKGGLQYTLQSIGGGSWRFVEFMQGTGWHHVNSDNATTAKWQYIVGVRNGASEYLYVDGVFRDSIQAITGDTYYSRSTNMTVTLGSNGGASRFYDGKMDEVQIANVARTADWVKLSYENQKEYQSLTQIVMDSPLLYAIPNNLSTFALLPTLIRDTLIIRNNGTGSLAYSIAVKHSSPWITVTPATGASTGELDTLICQFDTAYKAATNVARQECGFHFNFRQVEDSVFIGDEHIFVGIDTITISDSTCMDYYVDTLVVIASGVLNSPRLIPVSMGVRSPGTSAIKRIDQMLLQKPGMGTVKEIAIYTLNGKHIRTIVVCQQTPEYRTVQSVLKGLPAGMFIVSQKDQSGVVLQKTFKTMKW